MDVRFEFPPLPKLPGRISQLQIATHSIGLWAGPLSHVLEQKAYFSAVTSCLVYAFILVHITSNPEWPAV